MKTSGIPVLGNLSKTLDRNDLKPVLRPSQNGELVDKVAKMAHTLGREVATPAQAREILKMKSRSQLPKRPVALV